MLPSLLEEVVLPLQRTQFIVWRCYLIYAYIQELLVSSMEHSVFYCFGWYVSYSLSLGSKNRLWSHPR